MIKLAQKTEGNEINHCNTMQTLTAYEGDTNKLQKTKKEMQPICEVNKQLNKRMSKAFTTHFSTIGE